MGHSRILSIYNSTRRVRQQPHKTKCPADTRAHALLASRLYAVRIHEIVIYTDFKLDESYTPSKISIRVGSTFHDLQEIHVEELNEPSGWVTILPSSVCTPEQEGGEERALRTHFIQVAILANHQNGRDTHIRQIKIYTPRRHLGQHMNQQEFSTIAFQQYATVR
jgi:anaphase-promoting complex subunit 10